MTATMISQSSVGSCLPRWGTARNFDRPTIGPRVGKVAEALGTSFMPWQQYVADVAGELDRNGRLVYREVGLTIPRQSGKTTQVQAQIIDRCFNRDRQSVSYTAQTRSDARKKWEDEWKPQIEKTPFARFVRWRLTNGHEAMIWKTGSIQDLMATTRRAGHGPVRDMGVIDEAFAQTDDRLEQALSPSMITRPEPQLWVVSTAGDDESTFLKAKVDRGRDLVEAGEQSGICYFEWSASEDEDPLDEDTWWRCMPALGVTTTIEAIRVESRKPLDEFCRAYLNLWVRKGKVDALPGWDERIDTGSSIVGPMVMAIDAAPDLTSASIGVAGLNPSGKLHGELVDIGMGTGWVAGRAAALKSKHRPAGVVVTSAGPAAALIPDLIANGVLPDGYKGLPAGELAKGSQFLLDKVKNREMVHLGQPALMSAVAGAFRKPYGDGGFLWHRLSSSVDISPLVAVTEAAWGFANRDRLFEPEKAPVRIASLGDFG